MFRFLLILLLINSYGRGLGIPLEQSASNGIIISSSLEELAKGCASKFLVNEINKHLKECNVAFVKPYTETQLQCTLFYDITSQLCAEVAAHTLDHIQDDYTPLVNKDLDISDLCNTSKYWKIGDLPNYPTYKEWLSKILSNDVLCGRLCGGLDVLDVNYYCKFYKWGLDMLKAQTVPMKLPSDDNKVNPVATGEKDNKTQTIEVTNSNKGDNTQSTEEKKPNEPSTTNKRPVNAGDSSKVPDTYPAAAGEQDLPSGDQTAQEHQQMSNINNHEVTSDIKLSGKDKQSNISSLMEESSQQVAPSAIAAQKLGEIPIKQTETVGEKPAEDNADNTKLHLGENPEAVDKLNLEAKSQSNDKLDSGANPPADDKLNLELNPPSDDYQDSDEGKEGLLDLQNGDDGIDPAIGDLNESPLLQQSKPATKIFRPAPSFDRESQRDNIYPNMKDGFLDEQEDNFFPFFLTGVVLVVLIYVLYHNKSKVSKVVLGLIVEGRQPGRRRNSRGHSYRRLDTLEQAMSSNSAAAPSKIIY